MIGNCNNIWKSDLPKSIAGDRAYWSNTLEGRDIATAMLWKVKKRWDKT